MKATLAAAALLLAAACSDASGPDGVLRVRTDASVYRLPGSESHMEVGFTVHNTGSEPIAIASCGGPLVGAFVDRRKGGAWVEQSSCLYDPVFFPPRMLAPGEAIGGEVTVFGPGRYRIRIPMAQGEVPGYAVSPIFMVGWLAN